MSIKLEQINATQAQQELYNKKSKTGANAGFESAMAQELGLTKYDDTQNNQQLSANSKVDALDLLFSTQTEYYSEEQAGYANAEQSAMLQTSGALDTWDSYVNELGKSSEQIDMRGAYGHLQGLEAQVKALKQNTQEIQSPALKSIIEELDVMRVTETFKFNRGDYA